MSALTDNYERFGVVSLEEGLDILRTAFATKRRRSLILGQDVNTHSLRLRTFVTKGTVCPHCGAKATHFALERNWHSPKTFRYHLNLWGFNAEGEEILFTHDHVIPKARGGADELENTQTMCGPCNWKKQHSLEEELQR